MNEYGEVDKVNKYLDNLLEDSDVKSVEDISNNTFWVRFFTDIH